MTLDQLLRQYQAATPSRYQQPVEEEWSTERQTGVEPGPLPAPHTQQWLVYTLAELPLDEIMELRRRLDASAIKAAAQAAAGGGQ